MKQAKKTATKIEREKRNAAIAKERAEQLSIDGAMPVAVDEYLSEKYGVSRTTIWRIVNNI